MNANSQRHHAILQSLAHRSMIERGLLPNFSAAAPAELGRIRGPAVARSDEPVRDLRDLLWASIDEDAANKVERQAGKSAAALLLRSRIGERFDALVTGASSRGTWVRLLNVPVEGKLVQGFECMDVGDRMRVQLISVDVERGYIDY